MYMGAEAGARSTRQWGAPLGKSTTWQYSCTTLTWQYVGIPAAHHRELAQLPALQLIIQQLSLALRGEVRKGDAGILCEGVRSEVRKGDAGILCVGVRSEVRKGDAGTPSHRCSGCGGQRPHSFQGCALFVPPLIDWSRWASPPPDRERLCFKSFKLLRLPPNRLASGRSAILRCAGPISSPK